MSIDPQGPPSASISPTSRPTQPEPKGRVFNRRHFIKQGGALAAGAALLESLPRNVFAADSNDIRLALIGCGHRGTGAVADGLSVQKQGPVKLWAMADLNENKIHQQLKSISEKFPDQVDVSMSRMFTGFQAYKAAIDTLRPGDVAMCTTRSYIRPLHVEYAVRKGINVFMEKPFASDPAGAHRILRVAEEADKKGVKIAAGLQCRHSPARQALIEKMRNGEMGDITLIRANRMAGSYWLKPQGEKAFKFADQLDFGRVHLLWVGSGHMVDNLIHQIDECCWIKNSWPVSCAGMGGREPITEDCGQNHDVYSMEYTFADGTKAFCGFRRQNKARADFATYVHGTKCAAQFSGWVHAATVNLYKDQRIEKSNIAWTPPKDEFSPWQYEWNDFIQSIRLNRPHNEAKRAAYSDLASIMGRAACHSGNEVTWDDMMKSRFEFCPNLEELTFDSPPPVKPNASGHFPLPQPEKWKEI